MIAAQDELDARTARELIAKIGPLLHGVDIVPVLSTLASLAGDAIAQQPIHQHHRAVELLSSATLQVAIASAAERAMKSCTGATA